MKKKLPFVFLFLLSSILFPDLAIAQTTIDKINQVKNGLSTYHQIKGEPTWTIEERMEHYGVPGMSIAVIENYKVVWTKSYGYVDKEKSARVTDQTLFQAASISKPVSAYAALKLVEAGTLDLNKNVNDFLKSWQVPDNKFTEEEKVTLKHLVSHKAGLTVHGFLGYSPDLEVPTLVQLLDGKRPGNSNAIRVDKTPGGDMRYSGGGYCVMQQMMIDVTGQSFPDLMKEHVLGAIGMTKSTFDQPLKGEQLKRAATGYVPNGSMVKGKRHTYPEMAAAGLWTNASELAKFIIDLQQTIRGKSERVLSSEMANNMVTPVEEDFIGLGIFLNDGRFGHGGWNEGFSSDMTGHLKDGYGAVIMLNANQPPLINEVMNAIARTYQWENSAPIHEKQEFTQAEIDRFSRKYEYNFDDNVKVYAKGKQVFLQYLTGKPQELIKVADNTYVRREMKSIVQFGNDPVSNEFSLMFLPDQEGGDILYKPAITNKTEKLAMEWLMEREYEKALDMYKAKKKDEPNSSSVQEGYINNIGYQQLGYDNIDIAIDIFKINVALHPKAFNTYDSLGEAYMLKGEKELAIKNYKKSLELNAMNANADRMLKELEN